MPVEPGQIIDRYRVEAVVGEGGMATVYRVKHTVLDSLHALKILHPELLRNDDIRGRFLAEGRIQAQLCHPHIATVTDVVSADGVAGLVMEYLEGEGLDVHLTSREGAMPRDAALDVMLPVLAAVGHAHAFGVVHRDLKPSNVFLCSRSRGMVRPIVLDFGIAKVSDDAGITGFQAKHTATGMRMGTCHYMSPEQIKSSAEVDPRSDVFALGAILFEMVTGDAAFDGQSEFEVMQAIVSGRGPEWSAVPSELLPPIRRAMAHDADSRFPTVEAFATALKAVRFGSRPPVAPTVAEPVVEAARSPGQLSLVKASGQVVELVPPQMLIGAIRGNVEPFAKGRRVAYSHALLTLTPSGWVLEGRGRALHSYVDGERIRAGRLLAGGEEVRVGDHRFRVEVL